MERIRACSISLLDARNESCLSKGLNLSVAIFAVFHVLECCVVFAHQLSTLNLRVCRCHEARAGRYPGAPFDQSMFEGLSVPSSSLRVAVKSLKFTQRAHL